MNLGLSFLRFVLVALKKEGKGYNYFLNDEWILHSCHNMLFCHTSTWIIHMTYMPLPVTLLSHLPPQPRLCAIRGEHRVWSPESHNTFPTGSVTYVWCEVLMWLSQFIPLSPFPLCPQSILHVHAFIAACKQAHWHHLLDSIHVAWLQEYLFFCLYHTQQAGYTLKWYLEGFLWVFNWSLDWLESLLVVSEHPFPPETAAVLF